jgi:uncharacterized protein YdhG (YjbR/CyaY superfamily)
MPATKTKNVWTDEERAAMQASVKERKSASKISPAEERAQGEADIQERLAGMPADDRAMGARLHEIISKAMPELMPKTYYGMPAYAKDGKTIAFYKAKSKFKVRYSTFGFQPDAHLDDGDMWPTEFAVVKLTPAVEGKIVELMKKAAS